jgi:hypothetical protein
MSARTSERSDFQRARDYIAGCPFRPDEETYRGFVLAILDRALAGRGVPGDPKPPACAECNGRGYKSSEVTFIGTPNGPEIAPTRLWPCHSCGGVR